MKVKSIQDFQRSQDLVSPLDQALSKLQCYSSNLAELTAEFRANHIDPATGKIKAEDFESAVAIIQTFYNKVKEVLSECEGTEWKIELGDSTVETILGFVLAAVGFQL